MKPPRVIEAARRLRQRANTPEQRAWEALRGLRAEGWPGRRQHPVGRYIVDFAIVSARLVIEVDGGIHRLPEVAARDRRRQDEITAEGWRMLRVPSDVAMSPDHLIPAVRAALRTGDREIVPL